MLQHMPDVRIRLSIRAPGTFEVYLLVSDTICLCVRHLVSLFLGIRVVVMLILPNETVRFQARPSTFFAPRANHKNGLSVVLRLESPGGSLGGRSTTRAWGSAAGMVKIIRSTPERRRFSLGSRRICYR